MAKPQEIPFRPSEFRSKGFSSSSCNPMRHGTDNERRKEGRREGVMVISEIACLSIWHGSEKERPAKMWCELRPPKGEIRLSKTSWLLPKEEGNDYNRTAIERWKKKRCFSWLRQFREIVSLVKGEKFHIHTFYLKLLHKSLSCTFFSRGRNFFPRWRKQFFVLMLSIISVKLRARFLSPCVWSKGRKTIPYFSTFPSLPDQPDVYIDILYCCIWGLYLFRLSHPVRFTR